MERAFYDGTRGFSQSYLLSRIVRNAQRSTKVPFFIREIGVNTLRWPKSFSVILQITGPAPFSATLRSLAQVSPQRLPSCRSLSRSSLCHRDRNWPDREYSGADSQWTNPPASGSARVSTPRHFEELSLAFWSQRTPRSGGRSRPTTSGTLLSSGSSLQRHYRCRHHSAYHLWLSRRYRRRFGVFTATGGFKSFCCESSKARMPWPRFLPAACGPMPPTWKRSCGPTTWFWLSSFFVCPKKFVIGISLRFAANFGGCRQNGSSETIATS